MASLISFRRSASDIWASSQTRGLLAERDQVLVEILRMCFCVFQPGSRLERQDTLDPAPCSL